MPDSTATCGNIETPRMVRSRSPRPRNRIRARANAAVMPRNSDTATVANDTTTEFQMLVANGLSRNTPT